MIMRFRLNQTKHSLPYTQLKYKTYAYFFHTGLVIRNLYEKNAFNFTTLIKFHITGQMLSINRQHISTTHRGWAKASISISQSTRDSVNNARQFQTLFSNSSARQLHNKGLFTCSPTVHLSGYFYKQVFFFWHLFSLIVFGDIRWNPENKAFLCEAQMH